MDSVRTHRLWTIARTRRIVFLSALTLCLFAAAWVNLRAASVTVTLTLTRVVELVCSEGAGEACPNDFYAKAELDGQGLEQTGKWCNSCSTDFQPNWTFTRTVDTARNPIAIHIELWDQDDLSADNPMDIANGGNFLDLTLDLNNCTWQGGGLRGDVATQSSSQGSGDDSAKIYFVITTSSPACGDNDGDGLLNGWETSGYDATGDGIVDVNLPAMGANPNRHDLYLELDFLQAATHTHAPLQGAIQQVVQSFANAPVGNPDGTTGVQLHVDVGAIYGAGVVTGVNGTGGVTGTFGDYQGGGNAITETGNTIVDWDGAAGNPGTNFFSLKNMNAARNSIFRYGLFVHQTNNRAATNDCTSGWAKGIPGVNFLVSLGGLRGDGTACWGTNATGQSVGSQGQQAGTLMHEYGHVLGLQHGGGDSINNKPNYMSVMNYTWQACQVPSSPTLFGTPALPGGCDYSRVNFPSVGVGLNENSLDECRGIDNLAFFGPFDWNGDRTLQGNTCNVPNNTNVGPVNINNDTSNDANSNGGWDPGEPPLYSTLNGFQDWGAIVYNHRTVFDFTTAGAPTQNEPDAQIIEKSREAMEELVRPNLAIDKTGPASARPGDTLSYSIATSNTGRGPALNVSFTDTKPDLTTQTVALGLVAVGGSLTNALTFAVPCSTRDGAILTNVVQAQGLDLLSNAITSNSDSVQTTVQAPVLQMTKTATAAVNAGEAITYTIVYENIGSGAAANVTITDTLPAGIFYSVALDLGSGPKPTTVTLNADGTRTLVWNVAIVGGNSGPQTIAFTARPTLLAAGGTSYTNNVTLSFKNANGCTYDALTASASTSITTVAATLDPLTIGYWKTHPEVETSELLARIQATDQRYDRPSPDGALSLAEVGAMFQAGGGMPSILEQQLLGTYFNLATRRVNAGTAIRSRLDTLLGLRTVGEAALYAMATLQLPVAPSTSTQYSNATTSLDEINNGKSIR